MSLRIFLLSTSSAGEFDYLYCVQMRQLDPNYTLHILWSGGQQSTERSAALLLFTHDSSLILVFLWVFFLSIWEETTEHCVLSFPSKKKRTGKYWVLCFCVGPVWLDFPSYAWPKPFIFPLKTDIVPSKDLQRVPFRIHDTESTCPVNFLVVLSQSCVIPHFKHPENSFWTKRCNLNADLLIFLQTNTGVKFWWESNCSALKKHGLWGQTPLVSNKIINFHPWSALTTKWTIGGLHLLSVWTPPWPGEVQYEWNAAIERRSSGSPDHWHPKHTHTGAWEPPTAPDASIHKQWWGGNIFQKEKKFPGGIWCFWISEGSVNKCSRFSLLKRQITDFFSKRCWMFSPM